MLFPYSFSPWLIRKIIKNGMSIQKTFWKQEKVYHVFDQWIPVTHYNGTKKIHLNIRTYIPCAKTEKPLPIVVFFHGGGWVICSIDTHDHICRQICNKAQCIVISVEYRLAPEFKFPIPVEDAYAAACYIHANAASFYGDPNQICLSGDSAGGNLSIVCSQLSRERNGPKFAALALFYPSTDLRDGVQYPSFEGKCVGLTPEDSKWFLNHYINSQEERLDPRASPIVTENLAGLPPTLIITGEHDRIRDCGETYGKRLQEAGVSVHLKRYDNVGHAFLSVGAPDVANQALALSSEWLTHIFSGAHPDNYNKCGIPVEISVEKITDAIAETEKVSPNEGASSSGAAQAAV